MAVPVLRSIAAGGGGEHEYADEDGGNAGSEEVEIAVVDYQGSGDLHSAAAVVAAADGGFDAYFGVFLASGVVEVASAAVASEEDPCLSSEEDTQEPIVDSRTSRQVGEQRSSTQRTDDRTSAAS